MKEFFNFKLLESITEAIKKAYEKYKIANSNFWVISLSFYTILALVPISAILFSLGSWFGAKDYILRQITESTPLPREVVELISNFAENLLKSARNGVLAGLGFIFLGWTFIKMFSLVENSFNDIWHIKIPRTFVRKISDYIAFFVFLPLLFIVLNGVLLFVVGKIDNISIISRLLTNIFPYLSLFIFLGSLYIVMPNTKVKVIPALIAAFIISIMFYIFQIVFINLQALISSYSVIYGGFSVIFIFLIWIRVFWFFTILGVHLSYLFQNINYDISLESNVCSISFYSKLYITLRILKEIIEKYLKNEKAISFEELKENIGTSQILIEMTLEELLNEDYIIAGENSNGDRIFSITKNIDKVSLKEIYEFLAKNGEEIHLFKDSHSDDIEKIIFNQDYDRTLRSLGGK